MKIAIFHDYITAIGGAEKLILTLARALNADVITTDVNRDSIKKMEFEDINIISIGNTIKQPVFKQISASLKFALCDYSQNYDFFIFSGSWTPFCSRKHKPNLYYCHSPVRVFYDLRDSLLEQFIILKPFLMIWITLHKYLYEYYLKHVEEIIANSKNTQLRIKKYLKRNSTVIYPPINSSKYNSEEFGDFWLSVNRLYPEKRIELQIEAFSSIPDEKLVIVGDYTEDDYFSKYAKQLIKNLPKNIEFRRAISENELLSLYSRCRGVICTAKNEDFGMTPIEAMSSGKPVICVNEGGFLESVKHEITGLLVQPKVKEIIEAIKKISQNPEKYQKECKEQAKIFDESLFINNMREKISTCYNNTHS